MIEPEQLTLRGPSGRALGARFLSLEGLMRHTTAELIPVPHRLAGPISIC